MIWVLYILQELAFEINLQIVFNIQSTTKSDFQTSYTY